MKLQELLHKINDLKAELDSLKPLKAEDQQRLDKKFRLEWNYNSNHIEGNTLTYGQTELLLIFDKTTGDHDMREYEEMKEHDVAIRLIAEYAKDRNRVLTESEVRELNKIILVRPFWGNAQTPDGQPTRKLIQPGEYKKEPNSVRLQNGEIFHYASPEETPARMQELMSWFNKVSLEKRMHPVEIAAHLHYKFVLIHPFDDSNGRTSRLLMNYVLLLNGFPPVIIKTADKKGYLNALNKADVGDLNAFVEYIARELVWALEISIKAARGISIEEVDDVEKEVQVWKKDRKRNGVIVKTPEIIINLFRSSLIDFIRSHASLIETRFGDVFEKTSVAISFTIGGSRVNRKQIVNDELLKFFDDYLSQIESKYLSGNTTGIEIQEFTNSKDILMVTNNLNGLNLKGDSKLNIFWQVGVEFQKENYTIYFSNGESANRPYGAFFSKEEIQELNRKSLKGLFQKIRDNEV